MLAGLGDGETTEQVAAQRRRLAGELERAQRLLLQGFVSEEQFVARRAELQAQLAEVQPAVSSAVDLDLAAARLADLPALWAEAPLDARAALAHDLLAAVWVDLDGRRVEEIHLHRDLDPLKPALEVPRVGLLGFEPRTAGL